MSNEGIEGARDEARGATIPFPKATPEFFLNLFWHRHKYNTKLIYKHVRHGTDAGLSKRGRTVKSWHTLAICF